MENLIVVGSLQGFILGIAIIVSPKFDFKGNLHLGFLVICISALVGREVLPMEMINRFYAIYINTWGFSILLGPLIYLYVIAATGRSVTTNKFAHFVVPILYFIFINHALIRGIASEEVIGDYPVELTIYTGFQVFIIVQLLTYLVLSLRRVIAFPKLIKEEYANVEKLDISWLLFLLSAFGVVYVLWIAFFSGDILILKDTLIVPGNLMPFLLSLLIYGIGYFTLFKPEIFQISLQRKKISDGITLDDREVKELKAKVHEVINEKKVHLKNGLTIKQFAAEMGTTSKRASQLINTHFNQSFYDLINSFRIEEVKQSLVDERNKHLTIEGIALNCGFSSSSTLNRLFKAHTGRTPREYKNEFLPKTGLGQSSI